MKKLFLFFLASATLVACKEKKEKAGEEKSPSGVTVTMPYAPSYSASFSLGNPDYATMIVQGSWKDWENNQLDKMKDWVADTVIAYHSDNVIVKGRDSLMARWKRSRSELTSVIDSIDAVIPVYSTDKKENWVLLWAREINTNKEGKSDTADFMETWRINKDGKADMLLQYNRATRKK